MSEEIIEEKKFEKNYISARDLQIRSLELAKQIYESGFRPTFIIALWRGNSLNNVNKGVALLVFYLYHYLGTYIQEFLAYKGIETDHIAIRTSSYYGIERSEQVKVFNLGYIIERVNEEDSVLIIDDIFDSGMTITAVISNLKQKLRKNFPRVLKTAVVYYKPEKNKSEIKPDYFHSITNSVKTIF
jgi:uncharacterized protein